MLRRVQQTIIERNLIRPGMHVVAAVSGGADSIAMLYALWFLRGRMKFHLSAAHLHHGLRGRDADRDALHVALVCSRLGIPCKVDHEAVALTRRRSGVSLEMAAREARQAFFLRMLETNHAHVIAVAHHRDDQVETVLMRLMGGSGIDGLSGMEYRATPASGLTVIRPMLDVSRIMIETFLKRHRIAWRNDRTNRDAVHVRNRIRHRVIPFLEKQGFSGINQSLVRLAEIMREESHFLHKQTVSKYRACRIDGGRKLNRDRLMKCSVAEQRRVIRHWLIEAGAGAREMDFALIQRIRHLLSVKQHGPVLLDRSLQVVIEGRVLMIRTTGRNVAKAVIAPTKLKVPGETRLELGRFVVKYPAEAHIRRDKDTPAMILRSRRPGDRIQPVGMDGTVTLKSLFIDHKVPARDRENVPVLEIGGSVVWVAGYRVAKQWSVPSPKSPSWRIRVEKQGA